MDQVEMFLVRRKAGPYFTIRRTTLNPSSLKYGRLVCTRLLREVHSCRKSRLNKNPAASGLFLEVPQPKEELVQQRHQHAGFSSALG